MACPNETATAEIRPLRSAPHWEARFDERGGESPYSPQSTRSMYYLDTELERLNEVLELARDHIVLLSVHEQRLRRRSVSQDCAHLAMPRAAQPLDPRGLKKAIWQSTAAFKRIKHLVESVVAAFPTTGEDSDSVVGDQQHLNRTKSAKLHILESYLSGRTPSFDTSSMDEEAASTDGNRSPSKTGGSPASGTRRRRPSIGGASPVGGVPRDIDHAAWEVAKHVGLNWGWDIVQHRTIDRGLLVSVGLALTRRLAPNQCRTATLVRFLQEVQHQYVSNPYHNSTHAAAVAHQLVIVCKPLGFVERFSGKERLAMLAAALCHDVAHPGRSNAFLTNTQQNIALLYNDNSVLENFHAFQTFKILQNEDFDIFVGVARKEFRDLRQRIVELILATDMKQHFDHVGRLHSRRSSPSWSLTNASDSWLACSMAMKVADIGHSCLPWDQHYQWAGWLLQEFYEQADVEVSIGLPPSCADRSKHLNFPRQQIGYFNVIVSPLINELQPLDNEGLIFRMLESYLHENSEHWERMDQGKESLPVRPPIPHPTDSPRPPLRGMLSSMQDCIEPLVRSSKRQSRLSPSPRGSRSYTVGSKEASKMVVTLPLPRRSSKWSGGVTDGESTGSTKDGWSGRRGSEGNATTRS